MKNLLPKRVNIINSTPEHLSWNKIGDVLKIKAEDLVVSALIFYLHIIFIGITDSNMTVA